ncbi:MAG: fatty acid oxidation complex subunit alpha FadB [Haliea sp.]|uniref:fatty acid oxidation complex subunit alpha FadB n=1 Tax=Haliea sp. TaxID=1932666 RepID=UPI000C568BE6|nr:fatty acid oxidation complex subunit alpha FadB [Haliea sp.]MBM69534.1 fatty acid oxidation complex subunit alpha FadB [Haliea sp.]|tara:strand:+ start:945 stop:3092 length:2148 start_codon:yes stop_codon:yes gene_type:complete
MIYQSDALTVTRLDGDIAELHFDLKGESVNKFDQTTVNSLTEALDALEAQSGLRGLLVTSGKPVFIVGADITEFTGIFGAGSEEIKGFTAANNANLNRLQNLPFPSCVAINGFALGGGFEICLACDFRVMSTAAKVGLPETKLGILPGWGGTVRLPRIIGVDEAATWIAGATEQRADKALKAGAVDAVAAPEELRAVALSTLNHAIAGKLDYAGRRQAKSSPLPLNDTEAMMAFFTMKSLVQQQAGKNYPAPVKAVDVIEKARGMGLEDALKVEAEGFAELAVTPVAAALVGVFLSDQLLGKKARDWEKQADRKVQRAAVLGAGIMGGGIAYQSAYRGVPILMKDINQAGLDLGLSEANKLLSKRVERGQMTPAQMGDVLNSIDPTLTYTGFDAVDIVVEAVVENAKVKHAVLAETEKQIGEDTILASNTSTISITHLAEALQRPENFCGMHFFNPVHAMPLVEVIRGEKTSDRAVARTVAYANKMGKKAVVVKDCPGFLVNRVLFPYFDGFSKLVRDGADFQAVDKVMERWGWPMGPAYLMDVVGIDTGVHAAAVMAEGFPDRMQLDFKTATEVMFENERFGQKNGKGFYDYVPDKRGKPKKTASEEVYRLIAPVEGERTEFSREDIVARMMLPMATEMARCLEEGIVGTPAEADLALLYGLGFPPFRGGIFRWMDTVGLAFIAEASKQFAHLGKSYELTDGMQAMLADGKTYY